MNADDKNASAIDDVSSDTLTRLERVLEKCRELAADELNADSAVCKLAEDLEKVLSKAKAIVL
jgi:hypothetical protein